jgi:hypothetical protein
MSKRRTRPAAITGIIDALAKTSSGPWFSSEVVCVKCTAQAIVHYTYPLEYFPCPQCRRNSMIRNMELEPVTLDYESEAVH